MPTAKPRITITLTEQQHSVLSALSHLQKVSKSSIVVDLLDTTLPVLERLVGVLKNAATAPQSVLDELRRSVEMAEHDAAGAHNGTLRQLDLLVAASTAPGATRSGVSGAVDAAVKPPSSNRGVRITSPTPKNVLVSPMKKGEKNGRAQK